MKGHCRNKIGDGHFGKEFFLSVKTAYLSKAGRVFHISPHFVLLEMACKDGSDKVLYSTELMSMLEKLRAYGGFTIHINSGYRSPAYNRKIGGASKSQHTQGTAADISVKKDGRNVSSRLICCLCQTLGFKGVAYISPSSVHVDMRPSGTYRGDERKGYSGNVGGDFYRYFGVKKSEVENLKVKNELTEEVESMTQQQFNDMMDAYLEQLAKQAASPWSAEERRWAEENQLILGDGKGDFYYQSFCTREQIVAILYRFWQMMKKE